MLRGVGGPVNAQILDTNAAPVTGGTTSVFIERGGLAQEASTAASHQGNGSWRYTLSGPDSNYDHIAVTFVNSGGVNVTVNIYPTRLTQNAIDQINLIYDTHRFDNYDVSERRWKESSSIYGVVDANPAPTLTSLSSTASFIATETDAYVGGRIMFPALSDPVHEHVFVKTYNGAGLVTFTGLSTAPGVGVDFIFQFPRGS